LQVAGQTQSVTVLDLALKGALIEVEPALTAPLGVSCQLVLPLHEDQEEIVLDGVVAHIEGQRVGVACQHYDVDSLTNLRRLLELNLGDASLVDRELTQLFANAAAP